MRKIPALAALVVHSSRPAARNLPLREGGYAVDAAWPKPLRTTGPWTGGRHRGRCARPRVAYPPPENADRRGEEKAPRSPRPRAKLLHGGRRR